MAPPSEPEQFPAASLSSRSGSVGDRYPPLFTIWPGTESAPAASESPPMTDRIHLMVATPCFGGQVSSIYAGSVFHFQSADRSRSNIDLSDLMRDGDALISRA